MRDLAGRRVVITGGSGGIGMATARAFLAVGARVHLVDVDEARLQEAAASLAAAVAASSPGAAPGAASGAAKAPFPGPDAAAVTTHRSTLDTPAACAAALVPAADALVHLAGVYEPDPLDPADHRAWDRAIQHNLTNGYDLAVAFARNRAPRAAIVFASSIAFRRGSTGHAAYSAAKGGIVGLARALSRDLAPEVRVNAVAPGVIETTMTDRIIARRGDKLLETIPLNRFGSAMEVATVIRFLCSDDAAYVTGQTITIDGGMTNA